MRFGRKPRKRKQSPNDSTLSNPSRSRREMLKQYYQQAGGTGTGASKESSVNKTASSPNSSSISNGSQGSGNKRVDPLDIGMLRRDFDELVMMDEWVWRFYPCSSFVDTAAYHAELAFNKQAKEQNLVELLASNNNLVMGTTIGLDLAHGCLLQTHTYSVVRYRYQGTGWKCKVACI